MFHLFPVYRKLNIYIKENISFASKRISYGVISNWNIEAFHFRNPDTKYCPFGGFLLI